MALNYQLRRIKQDKIEKFNVTGTYYKLSFDAVPNGTTYLDAVQLVYNAIDRLLSELLTDSDTGQPFPEEHAVRFSLMSEALEHEINISYMHPSELTVHRVLNEVETELKNKGEWLFNSPMSVYFGHMKNPVGGGKYDGGSVSLEKFLKEKKSIIRIVKAPNNTCCARAIIISRMYANNDKAEAKKILKVPYRFEPLVDRLHKEAGVPIGILCGRTEWDLFQKAIGNEFDLVVISREYFNRIIYRGNPDGRKLVTLYHAENHFHSIISLQGFLSKSYLCRGCLVGYNNAGGHTRCEKSCSSCRARGGNCTVEAWVTCEECNKTFASMKCLQNHITNKICKAFITCPDCGKTHNRRIKHECGKTMCMICKNMQPAGHLCTLPIVQKDKLNVKATTYIIYSLETMILENGKYQPNLFVCNLVCSECFNSSVSSQQCICGGGQMSFVGPDALKQFGDFIFKRKRKDTIVIGHSKRGFDLHFILDYLHHHTIKPDICQEGRKILCIAVKSIKCIDSRNYLPMSLEKLLKAFGLDGLRKGFFPYLYNTLNNQNYIGPIPDVQYYDPESMDTDTRASFFQWYNEHRHQVVDLQKELLSHCITHSNIIQRACGKFHDMFVRASNGLGPFDIAFTLTAACSVVYKSTFLKPQQIGLIPPSGYFMNKQSTVALTWLTMEAQRTGKKIRHAGNSGEARVEGYLVDGLSEDLVVYRYYGCFHHGCPKCFPDPRYINPVRGVAMGDLLDQTKKITTLIQVRGHQVVEKWECEIKEEIKNDSAAKALKSEISRTDRLQPKDAFYGGRSDVFKLYHNCAPGESIKYIEIRSLYPLACKYSKYPIGHPEILVGDEIPDKIEGLLKCVIMPPKSMLHPFLPYRCDGKIVYTLCGKCARKQQTGKCKHTDEERALTGTWVIDEIEKALTLGYKLIKRTEALHFSESEQYNPDTKQGGLWAQYINLWMAQQQQAAGWPLWCVTQEQKEQYLSDYLNKEGIELDPNNIMKNEGLEILAQSILNSHWEKFGEHLTKQQLKYISEPEEFIKLITHKNKTVHDIIIVNQEHVAMKCIQKDEEALTNPFVVLAAYTSSYARIKLYEFLDRLGDRVLYCDTDILLYVSQPGVEDLPLGNFPGQLKEKYKDIAIKCFLSGGPKHFSYQLTDGSTVSKVKGFTLKTQLNLELNSNKMKSLLEASWQESHDETEEFPTEDSTSQKQYKLVCDQRYIACDGVTTYPYGYTPP